MIPMRAVIQRVSRASVKIKNKITSEIGAGLLVLVGIEESDNETDVEWLCKKIVQLRIFDDNNEKLYPMRMRPRMTWHGGSTPNAYEKKKNIFSF